MSWIDIGAAMKKLYFLIILGVTILVIGLAGMFHYLGAFLW
jgi:hypothetical protein